MNDTPVCIDCAQGFHFDCYRVVEENEERCCCGGEDNTSRSESDQSKSGIRDGLLWAKSDADIRDRKSTGRKRAAKLYPINSTDACEWRGLLFAGGGLYPIIGCVDGNMTHRHHGPIFATTANVEGNVHRICDPCHRVFHVCNDAFVLEYTRTVLWRPHDNTTQAPVELLKLGSVSEKMRIDLSTERFKYRPYRKADHDYKELLESLEREGETINPFLGI